MWQVVGLFDAGGSAFDSELWCDANVLNETYQRPQNIFQSMTVHLASREAFDAFKDAISTDPRLTLQAEREIVYRRRACAVHGPDRWRAARDPCSTPSSGRRPPRAVRNSGWWLVIGGWWSPAGGSDDSRLVLPEASSP